MERQDLAKELAGRSKLSRKFALLVIDELVEVISESLERGESVSLRRFGAFKVGDTPAHEARNPRTGETIKVPTKKSVRFSPSETLKARINEP